MFNNLFNSDKMDHSHKFLQSIEKEWVNVNMDEPFPLPLYDTLYLFQKNIYKLKIIDIHCIMDNGFEEHIQIHRGKDEFDLLPSTYDEAIPDPITKEWIDNTIINGEIGGKYRFKSLELVFMDKYFSRLTKGEIEKIENKWENALQIFKQVGKECWNIDNYSVKRRKSPWWNENKLLPYFVNRSRYSITWEVTYSKNIDFYAARKIFNNHEHSLLIIKDVIDFGVEVNAYWLYLSHPQLTYCYDNGVCTVTMNINTQLFTEDDYYRIIGEHKAKLLFLKHSSDEKSCREYAENLLLNTEGKDIQTLLREIKHTLLDRQLSF